MQYEMHFDVSKPNDLISESEGAFVLVDPVSASFLEGAALDYCDDLVGTGFRLHTPNAARSCGCGTSFEPLKRAEIEESFEPAISEQGVHAGQERDVRSGVEREATAATRG